MTTGEQYVGNSGEIESENQVFAGEYDAADEVELTGMELVDVTEVEPGAVAEVRPDVAELIKAAHDAALSTQESEDIELAEADINVLRKEIDRADAEILAAIKKRTEISRTIVSTRLANGGTRMVHTRELKILERFSELGQEGHALAMLLLTLGRGR